MSKGGKGQPAAAGPEEATGGRGAYGEPTGPFEALEKPPSRILPKVSARVALAAVLFAVLAAALSRLVISLFGLSTHGPVGWWISVLLAGLAAGLGAAIYIRRVFGKRLAVVAQFVDSRVRRRDFYDRLPEMGNDEVGRIASSLNALLRRIVRLRSSFFDQSQELRSTQEALHLQEELAQKSQELGARLEERAMLFEVLRESAASHDLGRVIQTLAEKLGPPLRCREIAVLLREIDEESGEPRFVVRAAWGFPAPERLLGRSVGLGEGIAGRVAKERKMILLDDVREAPGYLAFWGEAAAEGSYAALPIGDGAGEETSGLLGILALTRAPEEPLLAVQRGLLGALADHAALAIRNAQLFERLSILSTHDELTGLANRRLFLHRLREEIARARRDGSPLSLLILDVDHFKRFNDREGHPAGDRVLREIAHSLRFAVRENDLVARIGGEEIAVILPQSDPDGALAIADKLRAAVSEIELQGAAQQPLGKLSVSVGGASLRPEEEQKELLARADRALYEAKEAGRDRSCIDESCLGSPES